MIKPLDIAFDLTAALKHKKKGIHCFEFIYDLQLHYSCT
jgi:hypothetical protein